jgi:hypothetical protein
MISDKLATFADGTSLNTGAAGDYVIGDQVDLGANYQLWDVDDLYFVITVDTTATSGGSATLAVSLVTDDNAALASPTKVFTTVATAVASLAAGTVLAKVEIPKGVAWERYIGIVQTTGTAAFTAGKINAFLTMVPTNYRAFADALTASQ